jgi:GNAT superfamily N-acetyltransferase
VDLDDSERLPPADPAHVVHRAAASPWRIEPATPSRWPDVELILGERGGCGGCWCMTWRLPAARFERDKGARNRAALRRLVEAGPPPGILAYDGHTVIGWCAVAPRAEYARLARSRVLKPIDDIAVWSVSCLFVARPYRRRGVSVALLRGAAAFAAEQGARVVEGYPVVPYAERMPDAFAWTGTAAAFVAAGYVEAARGSPSRPIMRCTVRR